MSPLITIEIWTAVHSLFYNFYMCVHVQETCSSFDSGFLLRHILVLIRLAFSKFEKNEKCSTNLMNNINEQSYADVLSVDRIRNDPLQIRTQVGQITQGS